MVVFGFVGQGCAIFRVKNSNTGEGLCLRRPGRALSSGRVVTKALLDSCGNGNTVPVGLSTNDVIEVKRVTENWVRDFVVSLNLCPFAEGVLQSRTHRMVVSGAREETEVKREVWSEIAELLKASTEDVETTLVVFPRFAEDDFVRFHEFCTEIEEAVESDDDLVDQVMLACFHPQHEYHDCEDALNYDKRAPYPVVNLLRAASVDEYVEQGRTQGILERNSRTLMRMGGAAVMHRFQRLYS